MTKKEFDAEVLAEVEHIKKMATKEEIGNLDFKFFDPIEHQLCIYGQMTGDCFSQRAGEIGNKKYEDIPYGFYTLRGREIPSIGSKSGQLCSIPYRLRHGLTASNRNAS